MTLLLEHLSTPVIGYSLKPEKDSLFARIGRIGAIPEKFADIRDYEELESFIDLHRPSTIIHMAAQPLVLKSYKIPRETFDVNVMGTVNVLDIAVRKDFIKAILIVTTDKVYKNDDSRRAFIESDPLEGKDPYSASKVGSEAVVAAWQQIIRTSGGPKVVSVRAGNVIGGGDFAENRLIPDLIRGVITDNAVEIRSPNSTRPWQHVLDPITGYLKALEFLVDSPLPNALNFGPDDSSMSVIEMTQIAKKILDVNTFFSPHDNDKAYEANTLNLDSNLARSILKWSPLWDQEKAIHKTFKWWEDVVEFSNSPELACQSDIEDFLLDLQFRR
jgi:CDP-glucose 4,6-dehydratase